MNTLPLDRIPTWLHSSDLYKNHLDLCKSEEDNENYKGCKDWYITFPINNFRYDNSLPVDINDFILLYNTIGYWGGEIPETLYEFYLKNEKSVLRFLYSFDSKDTFNNIIINYLENYRISCTIDASHMFKLDVYLKINLLLMNVNFSYGIEINCDDIFVSNDNYHGKKNNRRFFIWRSHTLKQLYSLIDSIKNNSDTDYTFFESEIDDGSSIYVNHRIDYFKNQVNFVSGKSCCIINITDTNRKWLVQCFEKIMEEYCKQIEAYYLDFLTHNIKFLRSEFLSNKDLKEIFSKTNNDYLIDNYYRETDDEDWVEIQKLFKMRFDPIIKSYFEKVRKIEEEVIHLNDW